MQGLNVSSANTQKVTAHAQPAERPNLGNLDNSLLLEIGSYLLDPKDATSVGRLALTNQHVNSVMRESIAGGSLLEQAQALEAENSPHIIANNLLDELTQSIPAFRSAPPLIRDVARAFVTPRALEMAQAQRRMERLIANSPTLSQTQVMDLQVDLALIDASRMHIVGTLSGFAAQLTNAEAAINQRL